MFIQKSKYKFSLGVLVIYCGGMEKPILFLLQVLQVSTIYLTLLYFISVTSLKLFCGNTSAYRKFEKRNGKSKENV